MGKDVVLGLNMKFDVPISIDQTVRVCIVKLEPKDTEFMVAGPGVENPEEPRKMRTIAFIRWLTKSNATVVK